MKRKETKYRSNPFLDAVMSYDTYTENGAVSHSTTGNALLDYFSKAGTYRDRELKDVFADVSRIWAESPLIATQMLFYLRMVTRSTKGFLVSENVQKGQGVRDEYRKAMSWIAKYQPETLNKNMWLMPLAGAWKDLWHDDLIDVLDRKLVYDLIERGIGDEYNRALIAKYLPKIRSAKHIYNERHHKLNEFAYGLCNHLGWSAKDYRKFKSSGEAHDYLRKMSAGLWRNIDFGRIPGKALFRLANRKGRDGKTALERHGIEKLYENWLEMQPVAKFTGYVYELFKAVTPKLSRAQKMTIDKQFDGLIDLARQDATGINGNVWCALDTSGSMTSQVVPGLSAYDICISLGIYFSTLNEGAFHNNVIMFDNVSRVKQLSGTFSDKVTQVRSAKTAWGSTNFQSVIDEIVRVRKMKPKVPVSAFPQTLIVVSDMQFNPAGKNTQTNYEAAMEKLAAVGLPKMRIIWWWVTGRRNDFPSTIKDEGVTMIGGFDGSVVTLLLGGEQTTVDKATGKVRQLNAYENMLKALNQELLTQVQV